MDSLDTEVNRILERLGVRRERAGEAAGAPAAEYPATTADLFAAVDQVRRDTLLALTRRVRPEVLERLSLVLAALDYREADLAPSREERALLSLQVLALALSLVHPQRRA